ncbi:hypothetical protein EJB05_40498, partial [Eragrostis curvula]
MAPPPRPPPELIEDAVAEILLRIPPDEPADLFRAALVCKPWRRILSDRAFLHRYRSFHGAPPLLGFLQNSHIGGPIPRFVPATSATHFSIPAFNCRRWYAMDCRHGRALLLSLDPTGLIVWDPISGDHKSIPLPPYPNSCFRAAVLCATDNCDHLDCRSGPFLVVAVGTIGLEDDTWVSIYSSETGAWSEITVVPHCGSCIGEHSPSVLTGDSLYFKFDFGESILKYNLTGRILSVINVPDLGQPEGIITTASDGGLGFACVNDNMLFLWSWNAGPDGNAGWVKDRVIDLSMLLPISICSYKVIGFAEGANTIFISTLVGVYFTINLKSGQVRKVCKGVYYDEDIVPFMGFYTPDNLKERPSRSVNMSSEARDAYDDHLLWSCFQFRD